MGREGGLIFGSFVADELCVSLLVLYELWVCGLGMCLD